jgi:hypothetical protein
MRNDPTHPDNKRCDALILDPCLHLDEARHQMRGLLPDGRILCMMIETFIEAMSTMPLTYLDEPTNWLSCVDGVTVWIEDLESGEPDCRTRDKPP